MSEFQDGLFTKAEEMKQRMIGATSKLLSKRQVHILTLEGQAYDREQAKAKRNKKV
jgi:hypothetical protein